MAPWACELCGLGLGRLLAWPGGVLLGRGRGVAGGPVGRAVAAAVGASVGDRGAAVVGAGCVVEPDVGSVGEPLGRLPPGPVVARADSFGRGDRTAAGCP